MYYHFSIVSSEEGSEIQKKKLNKQALGSSRDDRDTAGDAKERSDSQSCDSSEVVSSSTDEQMQVTAETRSSVLKRLPNDLLNRLNAWTSESQTISFSETISNSIAEKVLGSRFAYACAKNPGNSPLKFSDDGSISCVSWELKEIQDESVEEYETVEEYFLKRASVVDLYGPIRDQRNHEICWTYATSDMVSISATLAGLKNQFVPLCTRYLFQNLDVRDVNKRLSYTVDGTEHSCYQSSAEEALIYIKKYGIPREQIGFESPSCSVGRVLDRDEELFDIEKVFKYPTVEEALVRLRTHPVIATMYCFHGWSTRNQIYRGPSVSQVPKFHGYHSVLMMDCIRIANETLVVCKSSNGEDTGFNGYLLVSLQTMLMYAGMKEKQGAENWYKLKPHYLLEDFYSIKMSNEKNPEEEKFTYSDEGYDWMKPPLGLSGKRKSPQNPSISTRRPKIGSQLEIKLKSALEQKGIDIGNEKVSLRHCLK